MLTPLEAAQPSALCMRGSRQAHEIKRGNSQASIRNPRCPVPLWILYVCWQAFRIFFRFRLLAGCPSGFRMLAGCPFGFCVLAGRSPGFLMLAGCALLDFARLPAAPLDFACLPAVP